MTQQTLLEIETATAVSRLPRNQTLEQRDKEASGDIAAILVDAAVHVGALIDAFCCRVGDWVDLEHYHPHPGMSVGYRGNKATAVRLTLTEDERNLHTGGYIEVRVLPDEKVVEADGGYYDAYRQLRPVIEGSLGWHELNPQKLGQVLMMMYGRIMREYIAHARFEENLEVSSGSLDRDGIAETLCRE
ncbi:MAG TPA: hypothetical protein VN415_05925 [Dehalococcoidia bacterium]|nr:hypothetical protein [Dehalococcoidia bacterium]